MVLLGEPDLRGAMCDGQVMGPEGTVCPPVSILLLTLDFLLRNMSETGITGRAPGFYLRGLGLLGGDCGNNVRTDEFV